MLVAVVPLGLLYVQHIQKRTDRRHQTQAVGCLSISGARLPEDVRCCDLTLPLSPFVLWTTSGETVLHRAASLCHRTICHYLVEAGASLMKTDLQVGPAPVETSDTNTDQLLQSFHRWWVSVRDRSPAPSNIKQQQLRLT